jgi:hypothetical protein
MAGFVVNNNESTRRVPAHRRAVPDFAALHPGYDALAQDMSLSCKRPTLCGAGRNSNSGFSPIRFWRGRQKSGCQD